jgi:hypothetical protein
VDLRDLIVTPVLIILIYIVTYVLRPFVSDQSTYRYLFPALTVRIIGALAVGIVYQFYYGGGGDTFAYHTHGSRIVWEALIDEPSVGLKLLFGNYTIEEQSLFKYSSQIWFFEDIHSYFIVRIASIFDIFTFSTYSGTAVLFALVSLSGSWALFVTFCKVCPGYEKWIALCCLFIPSVFFWGSGIFKDTITLAAMGWITYCFYSIFFERRRIATCIIVGIIATWIIFSVKKYILISFLPALIVWFFATRIFYIKAYVAKIMVLPLVLALTLGLIYYTVLKVGQDDSRYNVSRLAQTVKITAYDIRYGWGARTGEGSGYTLGELDGTWQTMIPLIPKAVNVSLFRPYFWEVKNSLMLLSAIESVVLLFATIYVLIKIRHRFFYLLGRPEVLFSFVFSIVFAFAVGISTYNFGTLSRYKIPMMPFYALGLTLLMYHNRVEQQDEESEQLN